MESFLNIISEYTFIQNAIISGILSGIACGITGTFILVKRITYIGGGIAHAVMGGLGIAYFMGINPLLGAMVFAVFAATVIGYVKLKFNESEDTIISAFWAIGMAIGIIFAYLTPGYNVDILSFLFGNILMVSSESLWILFILDFIITALVIVFYRQLLYVCFDEEYARLRGIKTDYIYIMLLIMVALTIVVLVQTVGLILVIALLSLPAATAKLFSKSISKIIFLSILFIIIFSIVGFYLSLLTNLPSGATIILIAGVVYLLMFLYTKIIRG